MPTTVEPMRPGVHETAIGTSGEGATVRPGAERPGGSIAVRVRTLLNAGEAGGQSREHLAAAFAMLEVFSPPLSVRQPGTRPGDERF